jgi:hypothetical protein
MVKRVLAGVVLSMALAVPAFAHDDANKGGDVIRIDPGEELPGPGSVQGPPVIEAPAEKAEVLYKFGVSGFLRGEGAGNFVLSDVSYQASHSEGRMVYRVMPYAFWHPTDFLDLHVQGQGYGYTGGGADDWQLGLYQGYLEASVPGSKVASLKAGRQEFVYGSGFMLGADSFFNGLTLDAGRLRLQPAEGLKIDILGGYYARPWSDGYEGNLSGAYATWEISDGNGVEGYFLRDTGSTDHHSGERVNNFGLRGTAKLGSIGLEVEPVYQTGEAYNPSTGRNDDISAFGGHVDMTVDKEYNGLHRRLWLGYAAGSGSRGAAEGGSARYEFHNPNNDTAIVGDMNAFGDLSGGDVAGHHASGLQIYTLGVGTDFTKSLSFSATGHYFRASAVESGFSKNIGLETDFTLTYAFSDEFTLLLAYDHLFTGSFFKDASGSDRDVHYGFAMLQFNLEKAKEKEKAPKKGA